MGVASAILLGLALAGLVDWLWRRAQRAKRGSADERNTDD